MNRSRTRVEYEEEARLQRELQALRKENERMELQIEEAAYRAWITGCELSHGTAVGPPRLRFTTRTLRFRPAGSVLATLRDLYRDGEATQHANVMNHALGQVAVVDDAAVVGLFMHLLSFADGAGSIAGLESLFLSCMHTVWLAGDYSLYRAGITAFEHCMSGFREERRRISILVYDRDNSLATFVTGADRLRLADDLVRHGFFGPAGIAGAVRGWGYEDWPTDHSFSKCLAQLASINTIGGAIVGGIAGALGGPPGVLGGAKIGAEVGAIGGAALGSYFCNDDRPAPAPPPGPGPSTPDSSGPDAGVPDEPTPASGSSAKPTQKEEEQQQSLPEEHPSDSDEDCEDCSDLVCGGYPVPDDGPDGPGGPAGLVSVIGTPGLAGRVRAVSGLRSMTFLLGQMPRLALGNQSIERPGFLNQLPISQGSTR